MRARLRPRSLGNAVEPAAKPRGYEAVENLLKWGGLYLSGALIVTGYVVEASHHGLLGIEIGGISPNSLLLSAVEFVKELCLRLLRVPIGAPLRVLTLVALTLTSAAIVWHLAKKRRGQNRKLLSHSQRTRRVERFTTVVGLTLAVATMAKVVTIDLPLTRLHNALVSGTESLEESIAISLQGDGVLDRQIAWRAQEFWRRLVCSRVPQESLKSYHSKLSIPCSGDISSAKDNLDGVFFWIAVLNVLLIAGSFAVLSKTPKGAFAWLMGVTIVINALMLPFAYGKLARPSKYSLAELTLKTPAFSDRAQSGQSNHPAKPSSVGGNRLLVVILLSRDERGLTILIESRRDCPTGATSNETRESETEFTLATLALSEIVSVRTVGTVDVLEKYILKGKPCEYGTRPD